MIYQILQTFYKNIKPGEGRGKEMEIFNNNN